MSGVHAAHSRRQAAVERALLAAEITFVEVRHVACAPGRVIRRVSYRWWLMSGVVASFGLCLYGDALNDLDPETIWGSFAGVSSACALLLIAEWAAGVRTAHRQASWRESGPAVVDGSGTGERAARNAELVTRFLDLEERVACVEDIQQTHLPLHKSMLDIIAELYELETGETADALGPRGNTKPLLRIVEPDERAGA